MSVLVTGSAGFIASQLSERLIAQGETVIGVDSFNPYYDPEIKKNNLRGLIGHDRFQFFEDDLVTIDLHPLLDGVDCIFHTAGQPGVRGSWGPQFDLYTHNNILATQRLLETVKEYGKEIKIIYSSSSSVYGNTKELPTSETALPRPYSPYGTTKLAAEHLCFLYHANYGIPIVSLRYFTVYGPRQRPEMAFHLFIKAMLQGTPITVLGDGSQTRDFTYVDDIVHANLLAAEKSVEGEIFNIGGGSRRSLRDVLQTLENVTQLTPIIEYKPSIKGDVRDTSANTEKAHSLLEYEPAIALEEGLRRQFLWEKPLYAD